MVTLAAAARVLSGRSSAVRDTVIDGKIQGSAVCTGLSAAHNLLDERHLIEPMVAPP